MNELPNQPRNSEVEKIIEGIKDTGLGVQSVTHTGHATALASLDVAESLQLLQLQIARSSADSNSVIKSTTADMIASNKTLSESNNRHATAMQLLTAALVLVGILQAVLAWLHK